MSINIEIFTTLFLAIFVTTLGVGLVVPFLAGIIIDVFSMESIFITGAAILGAGTIVFLRNHKA